MHVKILLVALGACALAACGGVQGIQYQAYPQDMGQARSDCARRVDQRGVTQANQSRAMEKCMESARASSDARSHAKDE